MKKITLNILILSALSLAGARAATSPKLNVGDPAPALKAGKWFKGQPLDQFETGKVYVVEFWATWCGPCRVSIPHLTEVAKKFDGKARIIGMSVWERETNDAVRFQKIEGFIKSMGEKMDYTVAADTSDNFMAQRWMMAAGETGIPTAFIVDRAGQIAWVGHPMSEFDTVLAQVVEGTYDTKAAAEKRAKAKERQESRQKAAKEITDLRKDGKYKEALAALDKLVAEEPPLAKQTAIFRYNLLLDADDPAAYKFARELADGDFKENPNVLATMAQAITERYGKLKNPDYALAVSLAQRASELSQGKNLAYLALIAEAYYRDQKYDNAIATLQQVVGLIDKDSVLDAKQLKHYQTRLEEYKEQRDKKAGAPKNDAQKQ